MQDRRSPREGLNLLQNEPTENEIVNSTAYNRKLKQKINFPVFSSNCTNRIHIVGAVQLIALEIEAIFVLPKIWVSLTTNFGTRQKPSGT